MGLPQPVRSRRTMRLKSSTTTTTTSSSRQHTCRCGSQHVHHNVSSRLAQYHNALRSEVTPAAASSTCWPAQERSVHVAAAASSDVPAAAATSKPEGRGFKELYLHANVHPGPFVGPIAVANIPGEALLHLAEESCVTALHRLQCAVHRLQCAVHRLQCAVHRLVSPAEATMPAAVTHLQ
jgi:hypothetical protein